MHLGGDGRARAGDALLKSANAQRRAERAAALAAEYETVIVCDPAWGRARARIAALHRRTEARHRAVADLHGAYATFLEERIGALRAPDANAFLAAIPPVLGMQSASVTLLAGASSDVVLTSDRTAHAAQDLEFTLGEGPARDCRSTGPLWTTTSETRRRWPQFGPAVVDLGVRSLAAVPLHLDVVPLGSLVVFGTGPMAAGAHLERLSRIGGVFVEALLEAWDGDVESSAHPLVADVDHRPVVHQAVGVIAQRSGYSPTDALALLRAHAFAEGACLADAARRVIDGTCSVDG